ncbi:hypothetical protein [Nocardia neocaledoniensis]|uniref:hypothetical protein n=1 Tax=Nocardia neocaledoniensis TaxID=236511 RepID=UPI002453A618|nr:hypothetical protein [Nocardia neocaledoniensis]
MKYAVTLGSAAVAAFAFAIATPTVATAQAAGNCHRSYTPCLPIVSDVDCEGGSGNGPVYTGRVQVIGPDDYGLDRDGNGIGCE